MAHVSSASCSELGPVQVDQTFDVRGVGSVLSGSVLSGQILLGQQLWLGPSETGTFSIVAVTGIQREQVAPLKSDLGKPDSALSAPCLSKMCIKVQEVPGMRMRHVCKANDYLLQRLSNERLPEMYSGGCSCQSRWCAAGSMPPWQCSWQPAQRRSGAARAPQPPRYPPLLRRKPAVAPTLALLPRLLQLPNSLEEPAPWAALQRPPPHPSPSKGCTQHPCLGRMDRLGLRTLQLTLGLDASSRNPLPRMATRAMQPPARNLPLVHHGCMKRPRDPLCPPARSSGNTSPAGGQPCPCRVLQSRQLEALQEDCMRVLV